MSATSAVRAIPSYRRRDARLTAVDTCCFSWCHLLASYYISHVITPRLRCYAQRCRAIFIIEACRRQTLAECHHNISLATEIDVIETMRRFERQHAAYVAANGEVAAIAVDICRFHIFYHDISLHCPTLPSHEWFCAVLPPGGIHASPSSEIALRDIYS